MIKAINLFFLGLFLLTSSPVHAEDPNAAVAEVGGKKITHADLNKALGPDLYEMKKRIHRLKENKIDEMIGKILLEKEATKKKMTVEKLIEKYVEKRAKKVSKREINKFYKENKAHLKGPKEQYIERIKSFLAQEKHRTAYKNYLNKLKKKAKAKVFLRKPERFRLNLSLTEGPRLGKKGAKVEIIEFSDFECPFCGRLTKTLDKIMKKYRRKITRVFKAFPLERHKNAPLAHQASLCADDQNKFWKFHKLLFKDPKKLGREDLEKHAKKAGLKTDKFRQCLDSGEKLAQLEKEMAEGNAAGVRSTPTLFINGQMIVGALPQDELEAIIKEELKRK